MERIPFLGFTLSPEIKRGLLVLSKCDTKQFRPVLEIVALALRGDIPHAEHFTTASSKTGVPLVELEALFTGTLAILKAAICSHTASEHFKVDLAELKIADQHIADMDAVLRKSRTAAETQAMASRIRYPSLDDLKWRVDVAISTSSMSRALTPTVLMEMTTSDGKVKTFEVSHDKFHELRFNVARVLKEVQDLEQLQILKIDR